MSAAFPLNPFDPFEPFEPVVQGRQYLRFQRAPSGILTGNLATSFPALLAGRPCEPQVFRRLYPDRWQSFVEQTFVMPSRAACFFETDDRTVRHWFDGYTAPQAWAFGYAVASIPHAAQFLTAVR